jgi:hypothetical protein
MSGSLRRIRSDAPTAYVSDGIFEPEHADETMERICAIVDWYRLKFVYREPEDAMVDILMRLQRSQMFGEPLPSPYDDKQADFDRKVASYRSAVESARFFSASPPALSPVALSEPSLSQRAP